MFHICDNGRKVSFLCPNGTVFRQSHLICDWWFRVDCERSIELYEESAEQLANDQRIFRERSEALSKSMLKVQTTQDSNNRVVTERSFGPSTTIFNSESRLPERARYFSSYSKDESQVPAETASFVGNQFQQNANNYQTPVNNWNQAQSSTTAKPTLNQVVNNNYQSSSYQIQPKTATQLPNAQTVNNFQSNYQPQYTTSGAQSVQNAGVNNLQENYQSKPTTVNSQINWSQGNNNYISGNHQSVSTTAAAQKNWNDRGNNGFQTENYQSYTPTTTQTSWNQGGNYQPVNYQTPSTSTPVQNNWNIQNANSFQTENYQPSSATPVPVNWNNQPANNFGIVNYQKQVTTPVPNTNWNHATNDFQSNNYQSPVPSTTIQPDWNQESNTDQPGLYQSQQPYQQPTTILPTENEQTLSVKESQVPAESASFVGNQNSPGFNSQTQNFYSQTIQTNPPPTAYPVTSSYPIDYSPSGEYSFVDYQKSPDTPLARNAPTEASLIGTTFQDYTANNSTSRPSGETLIPNMINSLQTLTDNNLLFDLDGQNAYPSQTHTDDELNSVALYFNNRKSPVSTVASDMQFRYLEHTSRAYNDEISSIGTDSVETTTIPAEELLLPDVLTQSTKESFEKLFNKENDNGIVTGKESVTTVKSTEYSKSTSKSTYPENFANTVTQKNLIASPTDSVSPISLPNPTGKPPANLSFAQGLNINRSSAELRELAAVFTRALTAYLDDPENFRKILAEVRPTEPPSVKTSVTDEQEVLDFSDDSKNRRGKPTVPTSTANPNLAVEINGMTQNVNADLSTIVPQYTTSPLIEITSKFTEAPEAELHEYTPVVDSEQLQFAGSQSFYSRRENSVETGKTQKPATSTYTWSVSPLIDSEVKTTTTLPPVYFTTTADELQSTVIVQRAKEMFNHLNASEAGVLMNVMKTAQANDTVKR